ncbi:Importin-11 [Hypsibius exemplaris]|uniref:Importin-11 n=1 Tax=Hypsibius exemplaris TaxID=2072580 RepID=A0A1W0X4U3_HYPEX|nr:Importin-11 [Hypsibius exemplaris]
MDVSSANSVANPEPVAGGVPDNISLAAVLEALRLCTMGKNPDSVMAGEKILQSCQSHKQFLAALGAIICDDAQPDDVRTIAAILFKNNTDKFWRSGALQLDEPTKCGIRGNIFQACFRQGNMGAVKQAIAAVGKIARFDYPKTWPTLVDDIGSKLSSDTDDETKCRAIKLLHECTKELATKRLPNDRKAFCNMTFNIFYPVVNIFRSTLALVRKGPAPGSFSYDQYVRQALYSAKVLQTLMVNGVRDHSQFQPFKDYWTFVGDDNVIMGLYNIAFELEKLEDFKSEAGIQLIVSVRKIALRLQRTALSMMEEHALAMSPYLLRIISQMVALVFGDSSSLNLPERALVTGMNIIKVFHSERAYRSTKDDPHPESSHLQIVRDSYFGQPNVIAMIEVLVTKLLPLTPADMERLTQDTEDYCNEIEGYDNWKFCLRPSAESLLSALCYSNQDISGNKIVELIKVTTSGHDVPMIVKEAVYLSAGLAAFHLFDMLDFDALFRDHLWREFQDKSIQNMILRRRILWLIGEWCSVRLAAESRVALFQLLVEGLAPSEHLAVRLMAAKVVKSTVDVFEFRVEDMAPVAPAIFQGLLLLVTECTSNDSQVVILNSLNITLERLESQVHPFVPKLLQCLMDLWTESGDSHLVQCGIVTAVKTTVRALKRDAVQIEGFASELIAMSTDLLNPAHVHLLTDGLDLWTALLQNSEVCTPRLQKLLTERLPALLEVTSENMEIVMEVLEGYLILAPEPFFTGFYDTLVSWASLTIPQIKEEGLEIIIRILDLSVQIYQAAAVPKLTPVLVVLVIGLPTDPARVFAIKMGLLARCLYYNFQGFTQVFAVIADRSPPQTTSALQIFHEFMKLWTEQINFISKLERRKLCGLAFMSLLLGDPK